MSEELKQFMEALKEHTRQDEKHFDVINHNMTVMKENHLVHIERASEKAANDIEWLKKFFWLVAAASVGGFIAEIISLI